MTLKSVLVATDFSDSARHAALRGATLARELGTQKGVLLHVAPQSALAAPLEARATGSLEHALAQLAAELGEEAGFSFQPRAVSGSVVREISRAAADFDLVVVGAYGMHPLRDFAIGTSAERLLRRTDRPVLVVKRKPAGAYRQVLAPVDFSPDARAAVSLARQSRRRQNSICCMPSRSRSRASCASPASRTRRSIATARRRGRRRWRAWNG